VTASSTLPRLDGAQVGAGEPQVHVVPLETMGAPGGGVDLPLESYITVLIPAHDEGDQIAATLAGLHRQTLRPTRVVVVADNCSDDTVAIARAAGAEVFETVGNTAKKAGALNQAWSLRFRRVAEGERRDGERRASDRRTRTGPAVGPERRAENRRADTDRRGPGDRRIDPTGRPDAADDDLVLVQDADSALDEDFLEGAASHVRTDDRLGAVGGTFRGDAGGGLVGHLQRNEYARYARDVRRLEGKCLVVTGTAAMFRAATLRRISEARLDGRVPPGDGRGGIYDTTVLTEDNELTFAILHLGYQVLSPTECTLTTEVMPTWRALWNQRLRWKRGAIENCVQYGVTRITWRYWGRQLLTFAGVVVTFLYLGSVAASLLSAGFGSIWLALAAFALIAVGTALLRIVPRKQG
jgi:biofilm PGA synthesis N-glycosyltransferase PgaC